MRLGIDISQVVYKGTGVSRFTQGLIQSILDLDKQNNWTFFLSTLRSSVDESIIENIRQKKHTFIQYPAPPKLLSLLWNDFHRIKIEKLVGNLDWFITSDWTEPPSNMKKATIVHDLTFKRHPETVDQSILTVQNKRLEWVKKESTIIFADSLSTKNDLEEILGVDPNKIIVNYPGVVTQRQDENQIKKTLQKHNISKKFILSVGKLEPRKNIARLIEAYQKCNYNDIDLVIVGPKGWDSHTKDSYPSDHIHWLGFIDDSELYALYQACLFFIFPSIWEGFGYPLVEAMQLGCPTAVSHTSSLGEIGRDCSYLFNPTEIDSIQNAIKNMVENQSLRTELTTKGLNLGKRYTWDRYFDILIDTLQTKTYL